MLQILLAVPGYSPARAITPAQRPAGVCLTSALIRGREQSSTSPGQHTAYLYCADKSAECFPSLFGHLRLIECSHFFSCIQQPCSFLLIIGIVQRSGVERTATAETHLCLKRSSSSRLITDNNVILNENFSNIQKILLSNSPILLGILLFSKLHKLEKVSTLSTHLKSKHN